MHRLFLVCAVLALALAAWFAWPGAADSAPGALAPSSTLEEAPPGGALPVVTMPTATRPEAAADALPSEPERVREARVDVTREVAQGAMLEVLVLDAKSGAPVQDMLVQLSITEWTGMIYPALPDSGDVRTDVYGKARLEAPVGIELYVHSSRTEAYEFAHAEVAAFEKGEQRSVVLHAKPAELRIFHGRAVAEESGNPLAGARVTLAPDADEDEFEVSTDTDGRFRVERFGIGPLELQIVADGRAPLIFNTKDGHATPDRARELALHRAGRLLITVADAGAQPVTIRLETPAQRAVIAGDEYYSGGSYTWQGTTSADGTCTIEGVLPHADIYGRMSSPDGREQVLPVELYVVPGKTLEVTWAFGRGRIRGRLSREDGRPLADHEVWLIARPAWLPRVAHRLFKDRERSDQSAKSDAAGQFEFQDVAAGVYDVGPASKDRASEEPVLPLATAVEILAGQRDAWVDVVVPKGLYLGGRVRGIEEARLGEVHVHVLALDPFVTLVEAVDSDGTFRVGPMPAGSYTVEASTFDGEQSESVEVDAGTRDIVLELRKVGGIAGRMVDADSGELLTCSYLVFDYQGSATSGDAPDGLFEMSLAAGARVLVARASGGRVSRPMPIEVRSGETVENLEVRLERGGRVRMTSFVDAEFAYFSLRSDNHGLGWAQALPGIAAVETVPAGEIVVELRTPSELLATRRVTVAVNEEVEVVFERE